MDSRERPGREYSTLITSLSLLTNPQLLLKILETSSISADVKAISETWPATEGETAPTPRAISERLVKIRAMAKTKGTGNFKVVGVKTSPNKPSPVKRAPRGSVKKPIGKTNAASKRKRTGGKDSDDADNDSDQSEGSFKSENNNTDEDDDAPKASPTKKVKAEPMEVEAEEAVEDVMEQQTPSSSMLQEV
ncbi:MAG: hypothetical protein LQ346_008561 [Caloplaca aetnensis]|nr:MAG: hypothetical protein LQ346_008561 [Caloplaca aetnensis]